jgi:hypothetical protein
MVGLTDHALTTAAGGPARRNRGVVFVHGVGGQRKSDTLLDLGDPVFDWLQRWYAAFDLGRDVHVGRTELSFTPVDVGQADLPPWTRFEFTDAENDAWHWSLAEVWWAESNRKPDLATMLSWSWKHLLDIIAQLARSVLERVDRLLHPEGHPTQPARWVQAIDLANCVGLLILYPLLAVVGYALLVPLMVIAQIPIPTLQNWILLQLVQPLLVINAGEFRMYLEDEVQAANVRRRAADAVDWLVEQEHCSDVIIVAHSEGCVVSFGMLTDHEFRASAASVRKFITLGAGLNKSWLIKPRLKRLHGPLAGDILWLDFWASYDPVPAGKLDPPRGVQIYAPTGQAAQQLGDSTTPISLQVTNDMNVLTDHGGYWHNDEQVVSRLVAEIDCEDHTESIYWAGDWNGAARARRERVSIIALVRGLAVIGALTTIGVDFAMGVQPPLADLVAQLLNVPPLVAAAAIPAALWWAAYSLIRFALWEPWDRRQKTELLSAAGQTARRATAQ